MRLVATVLLIECCRFRGHSRGIRLLVDRQLVKCQLSPSALGVFTVPDCMSKAPFRAVQPKGFRKTVLVGDTVFRY